MVFPRRHDALCAIHGHIEALCPPAQEPASLIHRGPAGHFKKGHSGNVVLMRSLRAIRKYIAEETHGNQDLIDKALQLAGIKDDGAVSYPPAVQARVLIKLLDVVFGREIRKTVEHSGTVRHESSVQVKVDIAKRLARLSLQDLDVLEALERKMLSSESEIEDAEITEEEK